ncbi:MAG: LptF/LptG family permease, partial [Alphaproteobacteria bacterium]|nr:LptF/LptG family permease [Alphaproteobacteria bacterium]
MGFWSILGRYVNRQLLLSFFIVFFGILGIILMFDTIEALRRVSGRENITFWFTVQYAVSRVTKTAEIVIPFVLMVAGMITFWRLSKSNEFVVIRSTGVSIFGFL